MTWKPGFNWQEHGSGWRIAPEEIFGWVLLAHGEDGLLVEGSLSENSPHLTLLLEMPMVPVE